MESFRKFCNSNDPKYLEEVPEHVIDVAVSGCTKYLKERRGKRLTQKIFMNAFGLNDDGNEKIKQKYDRDFAEKLLSSFKTNITGARSNDVLRGTSVLVRGAVIRIHSGQVYPEQKKLDMLRHFPDLWKKFILKLGSLPFFENMTNEEREKWMFIEEDSYHNEVIVGDNCLVEFLQPGNITSKLTEKSVSILMQGNPKHPKGWWTGSEIEGFFPRKPGSKARKHTLVMIRSFWGIGTDYKVVKKFSGTTISLEWGSKKKASDVIYVLQSITKSLTMSKKGKWIRPLGKKGTHSIGVVTSPEQFSKIPWEDVNSTVYSQIQSRLVNFTPAAYKSLIQKIIRYRPKEIKFSNKWINLPGPLVFPVETVLRAVIIQLIRLPGSFVPDIQRYVSGQESAFKRLGVVAIEDGHGSTEYTANVLTTALLSQRIKSWKPPLEMVEIATEGALEVLNSNKYWDWRNSQIYTASQKTGKGKRKHKNPFKPFVIEGKQKASQRASAVLDELKSFSSDLALVRSLEDCQVVDGFTKRPKTMYISHCVDQHWAPEMVFFLTPTSVKNLTVQGSHPYSLVLKHLWDDVSSLNPRKQKLVNTDFAKIAARAQSLYLTARQSPQIQRKISSGEYKITCKLNPGWISAMVGTIDVGGSPPALVTLAANSPRELIAIRRPSRDTKSSGLTPEQEERAIGRAKNKLIRGLPLNSAQVPFSFLKDAVIKIKDGDYVIKLKNSSEIPWDSILSQELIYQLCSPLNHKKRVDARRVAITKETKRLRDCLVYISDTAVQENADVYLVKLINRSEDKVLHRALTFLSTYGQRVEMNRVSRDGGGTVLAVSTSDTAAYQLLLMISGLYPAALRPRRGQPSQFSVISGPLLWHVRDMIKDLLAKKTKSVKTSWKTIIDKSGRKLRDYQELAINEMIQNHKKGNVGTFLWMKVGSGKTLIVLKYIQWLIDNKELPPYVIYTVPQSAIASIVTEISQFDIPMTLLVPLKSIRGRTFPAGVKVIQGCTPEPNKINIIASDGNMRKCDEALTQIAEDSLVIFDEVHKNMNDTKRTSVAQSVARLAKEFIAFTGTPVIDSKTYKLISWLEMIVPFEVNDKNFLVAANNMITHPVSTGVIVKRVETFAVMEPSVEKRYLALVPGALGGTNANPRNEDWQEATKLSYEACMVEMVRKTKSYIKDGRRVMVVAKDKKQQEELKKKFQSSGVKSKNIYVLQGGKSIHLTDETVRNGGPDYSVVIVPISRPEGYTLTRCNVMVTSVYPSNEASRTQIEGRINRVNQNSPDVIYDVVHTGILTNILENHNKARSLVKALKEISDKV